MLDNTTETEELVIYFDQLLEVELSEHGQKVMESLGWLEYSGQALKLAIELAQARRDIKYLRSRSSQALMSNRPTTELKILDTQLLCKRQEYKLLTQIALEGMN